MNQAALNMLCRKDRYNTDEIKAVNFNESFDVCLQMFRRIKLPGDYDSNASQNKEDSESGINLEKFDDTIKTLSLKEITNK